jgi:hypothetical protein
LLVPLEGDERGDSFVARFDTETGALTSLEAMRYREADSPAKILWFANTEPGPEVGPWGLPAVGSATWLDQGKPWAYFTAEDLRYNVDVSDYLRARGI